MNTAKQPSLDEQEARRFLETISREDLQTISACSDDLVKEARKFSNPLRGLMSVYRELDRIMEKDKDRVSCKKGCAFCCHQQVACTQLEANLVVQYAKQCDIPIDRVTLELQKDMDIEEYMFSPHKRCTFLAADNTCKIYDVRPLACRSYTVVTDPKLCNTDIYPKGIVGRERNLAALVPMIAVYELAGQEHDTFGHMLLNSLDK